MCMIVDKMLLLSMHYVILDFQTEVYLSDLIFPPCKALASVTVCIWENGQTQDDARVIAFNDQINRKALILSNMVKPVSLRYMKV